MTPILHAQGPRLAGRVGEHGEVDRRIRLERLELRGEAEPGGHLDPVDPADHLAHLQGRGRGRPRVDAVDERPELEEGHLVAELLERHDRSGLLGRRHVDLALCRVLGCRLGAEDLAARVDGRVRVQPEERVIERPHLGELHVDEEDRALVRVALRGRHGDVAAHGRGLPGGEGVVRQLDEIGDDRRHGDEGEERHQRLAPSPPARGRRRTGDAVRKPGHVRKPGRVR